MATGFNTQFGNGEYRLQFETDNKAHYLIMQSSARRCVDCEHMTNADRIRSMSDEELVVFLDEFGGRCLECAEDAKNKSCPIYKEGYYCRPQDIMKWLQQPAEGVNNG